MAGAATNYIEASFGRRGLLRQFRSGIPREQLAVLGAQLPVNTVVTVVAVLLVLGLVAHEVLTIWLYIWAAAQLALATLIYLRSRRARAAPPRDPDAWQPPTRKGLYKAVFWAALCGCGWGALTGFLPFVPLHVQMALILTMGGMAAGASATMAAVPQAAIVFILGCGVPLVAYYVALGTKEALYLALVFALFTSAMIGTSQVMFYTLMRQLRAEERARRLLDANRLREMVDRAHAAARESDRRLRDAIESISEGFILFDRDNRFVLCNSRYRDFYPALSSLLKPGAELAALQRAAIRTGAIMDPITAEAAHGPPAEEGLREQVLHDGRRVLYSERRISTGGIVGICTDISDMKRSEERLRQAQKMEVVGQLTGGIAHDFNNLLMVIQGSVEMLAVEAATDEALTGPILRATERGAELTQRLLAFSRQQPLHPRAIDLGALAQGMSELLTRTLGETIEVETRAQPGVWSARADPGQVENALLNLAINARDAMPGGGRLMIEAANANLGEAALVDNPEVAPGDYVLLSITDTGTGMSPEVQAHAFEPFFTTKEVGQGSGLGLSMVYGFAKQSGGHVEIDSREGAGTTVRLYLPRAAAQTAKTGAEAGSEAPGGRGETVLVIEDDAEVRSLALRMLRVLGYEVVDVADAAAARAVLDAGRPIDLVLSDVVLPGGMSGPDFVREAQRSRPELKVLFMSGYSAEAARLDGLPGPDPVLLNKPFRKAELTSALREVLDR